jgi:hypothetical protein
MMHSQQNIKFIRAWKTYNFGPSRPERVPVALRERYVVKCNNFNALGIVL